MRCRPDSWDYEVREALRGRANAVGHIRSAIQALELDGEVVGGSTPYGDVLEALYGCAGVLDAAEPSPRSR